MRRPPATPLMYHGHLISYITDVYSWHSYRRGSICAIELTLLSAVMDRRRRVVLYAAQVVLGQSVCVLVCVCVCYKDDPKCAVAPVHATDVQAKWDSGRPCSCPHHDCLLVLCCFYAPPSMGGRH